MSAPLWAYLVVGLVLVALFGWLLSLAVRQSVDLVRVLRDAGILFRQTVTRRREGVPDEERADG